MIPAALRVTCAVCAAAAVLLAGSWSGGALRGANATPGRPARATDALSYGPRGEGGEIPVGDSLEVNGQPMQLSLFYTPDPPRQVVQFYAEAFRAREVMPLIAAEPELAHVSGFDPRDGLQRFISALPQPDGQTLVMVGVTDPRHPPRFAKAAAEAGLPVPREHRAYLGYRSGDQGAQAETGQYLSSLPAGEVLAFYRRELPARGFEERVQDGSPGLAVFAKRGSVLSVAAQSLDEEKGCAVFVNLTSGDAR